MYVGQRTRTWFNEVEFEDFSFTKSNLRKISQRARTAPPARQKRELRAVHAALASGLQTWWLLCN